MASLAVEETPIPGLLVVRLPIHADSRGWFKENWQQAKLTALGLPDFVPVQNNVALSRAGVTRGVHAEPWDKYVSVARGRVFGAWVDLRDGASFGASFHLEVDPGTAVFVPRGVGNSYQALEDGTAYIYLVNGLWKPGSEYATLHPADPTVAIPWPIPIDQAEVSEKDRANPMLEAVVPVPRRRTLVIGACGQLGRALATAFPGVVPVDRDELDVTDAEQVTAWPWDDYELVLNAAGYTAVDAAETIPGRGLAWRANAQAPAALARLAQRHRFVLVHYSTDYVFDGTRPLHDESEPLSPLGVYGQTKAAGDLAVATAPRHYILRASWLVGDGDNFVRTMARLASGAASPSVVDDQRGRLTFTDELVRATRHLLDTGAPYGIYNCTNGGTVMTWCDVARRVFEQSGRSPDDVRPVTTEQYAADNDVALRPPSSVLDLSRLEATGFEPEDAEPALRRYVAQLSTDGDP